MKTKHSVDNGVGGLNQCHRTCSFFPPSFLLTEATDSGFRGAPSALGRTVAWVYHGWEKREGCSPTNKHDSSNLQVLNETVHNRSETFSLKPGRQSLSPLLQEQRAHPAFIHLCLPCSYLGQEKAPGLTPTPREVGKPTSLRFLIPRVIPSFRARWGVGRPLASKSLIWVVAKEKDFYKTVREMGKGCKWTVHL